MTGGWRPELTAELGGGREAIHSGDGPMLAAGGDPCLSCARVNNGKPLRLRVGASVTISTYTFGRVPTRAYVCPRMDSSAFILAHKGTSLGRVSVAVSAWVVRLVCPHPALYARARIGYNPD